jgi:hypothetical protein
MFAAESIKEKQIKLIPIISADLLHSFLKL